MLGEKNILLQMLYMPLSFLCNFKNSFNFPPVSKESSNMNDGHGFFFNFWHLIFTLGCASHISLCLTACALIQYIMAKVIQYRVTFFFFLKDIKWWQKIRLKHVNVGPGALFFTNSLLPPSLARGIIIVLYI